MSVINYVIEKQTRQHVVHIGNAKNEIRILQRQMFCVFGVGIGRLKPSKQIKNKISFTCTLK